MKICKKIQEKKRQKELSLIRNRLIHEINHINIKLESLQMLLVGLNDHRALSMNPALKNLLLECHFFSTTQHRLKLERDYYSLDSDWEIDKTQSSFDQQDKISSVIDKLKNQEAKPGNLSVFRKSILRYIEELQRVVNGCVFKIFEIDQKTSDEAYLNYLQSLDFRLDIVQEKSEPEPEPEKSEDQILLEALANLA